MLFPTFTFLTFGLALLGILFFLEGRPSRKLVLLIASYVFYMSWNPAFIGLIVFSTVVDFLIGRQLDRTSIVGRRRVLLLTSVTANLGLLAVFKYANFFQDNRGGPRNSDSLLRWDPDPGEGVWHATEETELSG